MINARRIPQLSSGILARATTPFHIARSARDRRVHSSTVFGPAFHAERGETFRDLGRRNDPVDFGIEPANDIGWGLRRS